MLSQATKVMALETAAENGGGIVELKNASGINPTTGKRIAALILILAVIVPVMLFKSSYDEFSPKHVAVIEETAASGSLGNDSLTGLVPGFYALGAAILAVAHLTGYDLLVYPVLAIPFAAVLYTLMRRLTGNAVLSSIIVFVDMSAGITGTSRLLFWMNALGAMLLYLIILLLLTKLSRNSRLGGATLVALIIMGISMVYLSYNYTGMTLAFLMAVVLLLLAAREQGKIPTYHPTRSGIIYLSATVAIVILVFSEFLYDSLIPTIMNSGNIELGGIEKFIISYLTGGDAENSIVGLMIVFPAAISALSTVKYAFLLGSIVLFAGPIGRRLVKGNLLKPVEYIIAGTILMAILFSIPRLYIGSITVTYAFLPGVLCTTWLLRSTPRRKSFAVIALSLLVVLSPVYFYENTSHDMINNDPYNYTRIQPVSQWYLQEMSMATLKSDELTRNLLTLHLVKSYPELTLQESQDSFRIMTADDVDFILGVNDNRTAADGYVINYSLNTVTLQNWVALKPWRYIEQVLDNNPSLNKVYTSGDISIVLSA